MKPTPKAIEREAKRLKKALNKWCSFHDIAAHYLPRIAAAERRGFRHGDKMRRDVNALRESVVRLANNRPQVVLDSKPVKGGRGMRVKWRVK